MKMKIECSSCKEPFEIPDGRGFNRAVCPFCEKPNDLRNLPFSNPSSNQESSARDNARVFVENPPLSHSHPLAPQMWIMAICTLIVTSIIVVSVIIGMIKSYQLAKAWEEFADDLNKITKELTSEFDKSNRQLQQSFNKLLKP